MMGALGILAILYLVTFLLVLVCWLAIQIIALPFRILRAIHRRRVMAGRGTVKPPRMARAARQRKKGSDNTWTDTTTF